MKSRYWFRDRMDKSIYKNIDIFNFNYFSAYEKESRVFQDSVKFSKTYKPQLQTYQNCLEYDFYNFQLFIELITRFHKEMWISKNVLNYMLYAYEDLKLCYRFLYLWYYNTAWFHLRWFFEKNIYWIYYYFKESKKIESEKEPHNLELLIKECLKVGELSHKNKDLDHETYNEYYFPTWEVLKLYKYYSSDFVHDWKPDTDLKFSKDEFKKMYFLIEITLIYIPRFLNVCIWKLIEKYWANRILNPVEWYLFYRNYLQFLFWGNNLISNQYSQIYNLIHDDKFNKDFIKELSIDINNLFEKEYLKKMEISNRYRKKAKWNKEKYWELMSKYYENINKDIQ